MIKSFGEILKETNLYIRPDPDSKQARFFPESGEDIDVGASLVENGNTYNFIWRRSKSNLNLSNHGFTHYITRLAYSDEKRVTEGQRIGNDTVNLNTDDGNVGLLCSVPREKLGITVDDCYYKESDLPPLVLLLVRQGKHFNGRIRLITCFPTDNQKYIKWYARRFYSKLKNRTDNLDYKDTLEGAQMKENLEKMFEQENFKRASNASNQVRENLIQELEENLLEGYQVFIQTFK